MAEPGPDCSSLLDEDLSSFVFSYLADSQVGSAGGLCCAGPRRAAARGGERTDPPRCLPGHPGEEPALGVRGCGDRLVRRVPRGSAAVPFSPRVRSRPRGCARPSRGSRAAAAPQPRRRFQHHSHVDSRGPPFPHRPGIWGDRGQVDGWMGFGTEPPPRLLRLPKRWGGGGAVQGMGMGGAPQGAARWGLIGAGLWDESCRASIPRIRAGILGDGGFGGEGGCDSERGLGAASRRLQNVDGLCFGESWVLKSD